MADLNERIAKYLSACPGSISGENGHTQTFKVACYLYNGFSLTEAETLAWLVEYNERCVPKWSDEELARKASQAAKATHKKVKGHLISGNGKFKKEDFEDGTIPDTPKPAPAKITLDPATEIEKFLKGFRCAEVDLCDASPINLSDDWIQDGPLLLESLYAADEKINFVTDFKMSDHKNSSQKAVPSGYGKTHSRSDLATDWSVVGVPQSDAGGWMRMNPTDGAGISDANITAFRFILLEFDSIPPDLQISFLAKLPLPIAAILTSGGKSVHAWVRADCKDLIEYKDTATMLLKMLSKFGLDAKNKNPSRLSRLVGATRKIGASGDGRQRLLYLSPAPEQKAIL